jgi:NAD(P)-dependent dehydrogenase (short-subunit alcohol dehydrogenase family)
MSQGDCALVVGVGDRQGIGGALSVLLGRQGLHVFMVGRTPGKLEPLIADIQAQGGTAQALTADCTQPADMQQVFSSIRESRRNLRFMLYNTGRNIPSAFLESELSELDAHFKRGAYGGLLAGQGALELMLQQSSEHGHRGSIIYTGASASLRGKPMFAGFSAAKAGLRAMAQSMAREFGPQGIHVAHVLIDGVVDGAIVQQFGSGIGRFLLKRKGRDGSLQPDEVAKAMWMLHQQPPRAWTHELDLRPYKESF